MTIYVESTTSNQGRSVSSFSDRQDLARYADEKSDIWVKSRMTIDEILDALYDTHIVTGMGSVSHSRISRKNAIQAIRDGATNETFLNVTRKDI